METKEQILSELRKILVELFDFDESIVTAEAQLYEELDMDSIDAIDLIIKLQAITGKKVKPEEFKSARTVQDIVDVVYCLIHESSPPQENS